jgi:hypothetical protein
VVPTAPSDLADRLGTPGYARAWHGGQVGFQMDLATSTHSADSASVALSHTFWQMWQVTRANVLTLSPAGNARC